MFNPTRSSSLPFGIFVALAACMLSCASATIVSENGVFYDRTSDNTFGISSSISSDGLWAVVGAPNQEDSDDIGLVFLYSRTSGSWALERNFTSPFANSTSFGTTVAISGDGSIVAVGAPDDDDRSVYVFNTTDEASDVTKVTMDPAPPAFSEVLHMSDDAQHLLIGDESNTTHFSYNGSNWEKGTVFYERVASALSGDGLYAFIGALDEFHIMVRSGNTWTEQQEVYPYEPRMSEGFELYPAAVALSGDGSVFATIVNYPSIDMQVLGGIFVFTRNGTLWNQTANLRPSSTDLPSAAATLSVSGDGKVIVAGFSSIIVNLDTYARDSSGAAHVLARSSVDTDDWVEVLTIDPSTNEEGGGQFGSSVSTSSDGLHMVIGAEDNNSTGSAFLYTIELSVECDPGFYCPYGNGTQIECSSGSYCPADSPWDVPCEAGKYCPDTITAVDCAEGYYCPSGSTNEGICEEGFFCSTPSTRQACIEGELCPEGSTTNVKCPAGSYCPSVTEKVDCEAGYTCDEGQAEMDYSKTCPAGQYCPVGSSTGEACEEGDFCPEGSTSIEVCEAGSYCPTPSERIECVATEYCPEGSTSNDKCEAGSYCPTPSEKRECVATEYCPEGSITNPKCPEGFYCSTPSTRQACIEGELCPEGSTINVKCPAGSYCPSVTEKVDCEAGYTCDEGQAEMDYSKTCPTGQYCPVGSSTGEACQEGDYCPEGSTTNSKCPAGSYCPSSSEEVDCEAGYICDEGQVEMNYNKTCPAGQYCLVGSSIGQACEIGDYCPVGSTTKSKCSIGYFCTSPTSRESCPQGTICNEGSTQQEACPVGSYCPTPFEAFNCSASCPSGKKKSKDCSSTTDIVCESVSESELTSAETAGIALGVTFAVAVVVVATVFIIRMKKTSNPGKNTDGSDLEGVSMGEISTSV